jgi:hypothetical protein
MVTVASYLDHEVALLHPPKRQGEAPTTSKRNLKTAVSVRVAKFKYVARRRTHRAWRDTYSCQITSRLRLGQPGSKNDGLFGLATAAPFAR